MRAGPDGDGNIDVLVDGTSHHPVFYIVPREGQRPLPWRRPCQMGPSQGGTCAAPLALGDQPRSPPSSIVDKKVRTRVSSSSPILGPELRGVLGNFAAYEG